MFTGDVLTPTLHQLRWTSTTVRRGRLRFILEHIVNLLMSKEFKHLTLKRYIKNKIIFKDCEKFLTLMVLTIPMSWWSVVKMENGVQHLWTHKVALTWIIFLIYKRRHWLMNSRVWVFGQTILFLKYLAFSMWRSYQYTKFHARWWIKTCLFNGGS